MIKKLLLVLLSITCFLVLIKTPIAAEEGPVNIYFFWSKTCPHCAKMKPFLETIAKENQRVRLYSLEISTNYVYSQFLQQVGKKLNADVSGVPFTVIGKTGITGWSDRPEAKKQFSEIVEKCLELTCEDPIFPLLPDGTEPLGIYSVTPKVEPSENEEDKADKAGEEELQKEDSVSLVSLPAEVSLPLFGAVQTRDLSLPVLTLVIALLDGFNPCAMWVLLFLISMLLGIESKPRRWILGISFLAASGLVYFLFLAAWLNLFLFLGWVFWLRILVGLVAIWVGVMHVRDWYLKHVVCVVGDNRNRQKVFEKIREVVLRRQILWAVVGIVLLAFAVNIVELICSFALPAAYTQALTINELPSWQYYGYLLFYILIFLLDDLGVFVVAMVTLEAVGMEGKYSRYVHLLGGVLMLLLGMALLFRPEILRFGM